MFTDDLRGGLEGAGLGFLSGAVVGILTFFTIAMILDGEPAKGEYAGSYYAGFCRLRCWTWSFNWIYCGNAQWPYP